MNVPEFLPRNPAEHVNVFAHYYRAEMQRAISWRDRLDQTTNWAIASVAGILSVSLNQPEKHHGLLLFGMAIVFLLLIIESRRYRYFDVYRRRVRVFETGYYAQIMKPGAAPPDNAWLADIADSLRAPALILGLREAMAHRLRRNYVWIFLILLAAWIVKIWGPIMNSNAQPGQAPSWTLLSAVLIFYAWLAFVMIRYRHATVEAVLREV
ncbi:MAG: DUF2270 domain-containing protein [Acidobacteriota bacterium]